MTIQYESNYAGEFILSEGNGEISREKVAISTGGNDLQAGTILKESGGTYSAWGSGDTAKAILYANIKDGVTEALVIRRFAEVDGKKLVYPAGETGYEAGLNAEGIVIRDGSVTFAPDRIVPTYTSSAVGDSDKKKITLTFSENLANIVPAKTAFEVKKGGAAQTISSVTISGATVILAFANNFAKTDTITVAYTQPTSKPLQDTSNNLVASFEAQNVTNSISE